VAFFAVTLETGPNWDHSRGRREQDAWEDHAAFMDGLVDDGFLILGGPLDDVRTMHAIEAADEQEVRDRFEQDPWAPMGLLRIAQVQAWTIWLDGVGVSARR
jgi:uncharacterized protein